MVNIDLLKDFVRDNSNKALYRRVIRNFRRCYSGIMPKKYLFLPQQPAIYPMSKSICIEFPAWGSFEYRYELSSLENRLSDNFLLEVHHFNGKITFILKGVKE